MIIYELVIRKQIGMKNFNQIRQHHIRIGQAGFPIIVAAMLIYPRIVIIYTSLLKGLKLGKTFIFGQPLAKTCPSTQIEPVIGLNRPFVNHLKIPRRTA